MKARRIYMNPRYCLSPFCLLALVLLASCIPIEAFGEYWDKGIVDPDLDGHWKKIGCTFLSQDQYMSFLKEDDHYALIHKGAEWTGGEGMPDVSIPAKTLIIGKHKFLMMDGKSHFKEVNRVAKESVRKSVAEGELTGANEDDLEAGILEEWEGIQGLQRYSVQGDVMTLYLLSDRKLHKSIKRGEVEGTIPAPENEEETDITIPRLSKLDEKTIEFLKVLANDPTAWERKELYHRIEDLEKALKEARAYAVEDPKDIQVVVDLPDFKYFTDGRADTFRRHLQASPEWEVVQEGDQIVCYRRRKKSYASGEMKWDMWERGPNGYESNWSDQDFSNLPFKEIEQATEEHEKLEYQIRYFFRFSKKGGQPHSVLSRKGPYYKEVGPLPGNVQLKLRSDDQGIHSYLVVGQRGLWFEFFEQTNQERRIKTREALNWLTQYTADFRRAEKEIEQNGYSSKLMPKGGVSRGQTDMEIMTPYPKWKWLLQVTARVNPAQQGYVYLKAFDAESNDPFDEKHTSWGAKEYIGWSKDEKTLFLYNAEMQMPRNVDKEHKKIRIEVWFRPSDGKPSREWFQFRTLDGDIKLIEKTHIFKKQD